MSTEFVDTIYVGCATDDEFAPPTCAMLSSLDDNGNLPEARVIVADFGLSERYRDDIVLSAGRLGDRLTFLPLDRSSSEIVALPDFDFPFPLIGRLVIPRTITAPNARLITLDSDMIVNWSLRPLFEMSMRGFPIAAVHDPVTVRVHFGREPDHHYFNAGMMLMDIDLFNADDYGAQVMRRLASYAVAPKWFDQDALNEVLRGKWLTLDRRWNFFHAADRRPFTTADYEGADIVHFAGPKPWHGSPHPGSHLYRHHAKRAEEKRGSVGSSSARIDRLFAGLCYEVLLGRQMEADGPFHDRRDFTREHYADVIRTSAEFEQEVLARLRGGVAFAKGRFEGRPSFVHRAFAAEQLRVTPSTGRALRAAEDWRTLLGLLMEDRLFAKRA